ncbi:MAG: RHS repeat domain-containing protein [Bellilinea sp.]
MLHLDISIGVAQYQYDGRGNLARVTNGTDVTQYAYDAADRLSGVTLPDGTAVAYTYDAVGRRVRQSVAAQVTNYLWDELSPHDDVVLETDGSGSTLASYVLGGAELLSQTRGGVTSYYLHDGQGSVRNLTDGSSAVTDAYAYTAYGEPYSQSGSSENSYQYTGQQYDQLTGLYYMRARYYLPGEGRFLSADPINKVDPSGLFEVTLDYGLTINWVAIRNQAAIVTLSAATACVLLQVLVSLAIPPNFVSKGKWSCIASCNIQNYGNIPCAPLRVQAQGSGPSQTAACEDAKRNAVLMAPPGTYARHCQCFGCHK